MARVFNNPLLQGARGKIGNGLVVKQYRQGTVISAFPQTSKKKKKTDLQEARQAQFAQAIAYAKHIVKNPTRKADYAATIPSGKKVYHAAIQEYLKNNPI